ncbi:hypothetical protein K1T71_006102 [Dendrolimus kikuchii]|uniref:Uncharacterized protein n=1 Tax=Dendrolimus kikuchii TaxID=765133 RepID=A0ACC1D2U7_9NEOP|nr:hypothetical protein K1T71_006102 [Dendrolimus kikuchii]
MADYKKPYQPQNISYIQQEGNRNKVYINPNFNKNPTSSQNCSTNMYMHVNPRFQYYMANRLQQTQSALNTKKIYVNPNFFRSELKATLNDSGLKSHKNDETYSCLNIKSCIEEKIIDQPTILIKSRYCLVRNNEKKSIESNCSKNPTSTIKISKYKSVAINTVKKNIGSVKNKSFAPLHAIVHTKQQKPPTLLRVDSKIVKSSLTLDKRKSSLVHNKIKIEKHKLKKNNIPCPLFKKFGKCIRGAKGCCEFLHDKKHVNICRRFLKGICHDKNCLLSHDLTAKKMPTCYFYLNGVCAKDSCPYLHVKINENTKMCPDFIKGYCEKAQHCIYRHININQTKSKNKKPLLKKQSQFPQNMRKEQIKPKHIKYALEHKQPKYQKNEKDIEYRYYKELKDENSIETETIKPSRCKLGVLPTFIQL